MFLWCHTCNSECLWCCCCCWPWWRWFKLKDEYISVYSFLLFIWLTVHWTHETLRLCTKLSKCSRSAGRSGTTARERERKSQQWLINQWRETKELHQNKTAHEPQITSVHHKYLRRLFYVLKFCFYILLVALTTCSHIIFYCELFILCFFFSLIREVC